MTVVTLSVFIYIFKIFLPNNMFDTDKFIQTIQAHSALWEIGSKEYMNADIKKKCWAEVGGVMYADWNEKEQQEKDETEKTMKNTWRHIRDNYMRYLNQGKSGDSAKGRRKYIYADSLTFLLQSLVKRRTCGNFKSVETLKDTDDDSFAALDCLETSDDLDLNNSNVNDFNTKPSEPLNRKRTSPFIAGRQYKRNVTTSQSNKFQSQLLGLLKEPELSILLDPDNMMLLSFSPKYKKLNEDQKIDFQMHMLQFFKNINRPIPALNQSIIPDIKHHSLY